MISKWFFTQTYQSGGLRCTLVLKLSDIVVQGHFQVVSVILAPSKSNLCAFFIAVSSLKGGIGDQPIGARVATAPLTRKLTCQPGTRN